MTFRPASRSAKRKRISYVCKQCGVVFEGKPSKARVYCSVKCRGMGRRTIFNDGPRPCEMCGAIFTPSRGYEPARYCSKSCIWKATKGPEFNARISRETGAARGDKQRGTGTRGYIKRNQRHEHRGVAEQKLGRLLLPSEVVHHIDENKHNNHPDNLAVMTRAEHMREHGLGIPGVPPMWMRK
jgi:HNH endonuclease